MWYDKIIDEIIQTRTDILFIIDSENLTKYSIIKEKIKEQFKNIIIYENELSLRKELRNQTRLAVIFQNSKDIPYDLYSIHASIEIGIKNIFPLLDNEVLRLYACDDFQKIYKEYENIKDRYESLSKEDTIDFIGNIVSAEDMQSISELADLDYENWGKIAGKYGEICYNADKNNQNIDKFREDINAKFAKWVMKNYKDLIYIADAPLHTNILKRVFNTGNNALICFDCMGFQEWNIIKDYLKDFQFEISYSFTMLPSETSYSRRALFSGLMPVNMGKENEEALFINALTDRASCFHKVVDPVYLTDIDFSDYNAIGIIFYFIDQFTHSRLMNKRKLMMNIESHLMECGLDTFIRSLLDKGINVYITSDHGSIFCRGNGIRVHKDLLDTRSRRYLISGERKILEQYQNEYSSILEFPNMIGDEYILLLRRDMFAGKNEKGLTHGGISIEEMIVPFVRVKY